MEVVSKIKHIRMSPRKLRLVCDLIRGKNIDDARKILKFSIKRGSKPVFKCLESAVHNADVKKVVDVDTLFVKSIMVDQGPQMKRFMPRAMGRASRILHRTSHLSIVLDER